MDPIAWIFQAGKTRMETHVIGTRYEEGEFTFILFVLGIIIIADFSLATC
jgi:hypothetical protein